jgi:hypothetical protein
MIFTPDRATAAYKRARETADFLSKQDHANRDIKLEILQLYVDSVELERRLIDIRNRMLKHEQDSAEA